MVQPSDTMAAQADPHFFRRVEADDGASWRVGIRSRDGLDFKGRYYFVAVREDAPEDEVRLEDLRWNSDETARRTLETMSEVELRRRLRGATGRRPR